MLRLVPDLGSHDYLKVQGVVASHIALSWILQNLPWDDDLLGRNCRTLSERLGIRSAHRMFWCKVKERSRPPCCLAGRKLPTSYTSSDMQGFRRIVLTGAQVSMRNNNPT